MVKEELKHPDLEVRDNDRNDPTNMTDTSQPDAFPKGGDHISKSIVDVINTNTWRNYTSKALNDV
jgi:hypothetical protein